MGLPSARPGRDGGQKLLELQQALRQDPRPEGRRSGGFSNVSCFEHFEQMDSYAAEVSDCSRAPGLYTAFLASSDGTPFDE